MNILNTATVIIGSIISLGVLIAGAGFGIGKWYEGKNKRKFDDTSLFNEQLEALKKIIDEQKNAAVETTKKRDAELQILRDDIKKHTSEIGRLNGIIEEKEKKNQELTAMLNLRDPALTEYIKFGRESILEFQKGMKMVIESLGAINQK